MVIPRAHTSPPRTLTVLSAGAAKEIFSCTADLFSKDTGCAVELDFAPVGAIRRRLSAGEIPDIVVLSAAVMEEFHRLGKILPETVREVGEVGVGIAVRDGAPDCDISTPAALRQTLLSAASVVYADPEGGASSGIHFASVIEQLGIAAEVRKKSLLLPGGYAIMEAVADGRAQIGIQQITEILPVKGVFLLGPLPPALQKVTGYAAAVLAVSTMRDVALEMLRYLRHPDIVSFSQTAGFGRY